MNKEPIVINAYIPESRKELENNYNDTLKIKIISDGTCNGTKILNENDQPIHFVQKIEWSIDSESFTPNCKLTLSAITLNSKEIFANIDYNHILDQFYNDLTKEQIYSLYKIELERRIYLEEKYNDHQKLTLLEDKK